MLKMAIIGGGRMGSVHAGVLAGLSSQKEQIELIAVADMIPETAKKLQELTGAGKVYTDLDALLADTEIEGVFVATPTFTHFELVKKILQSGKHCLCEKPLTMEVETSRELTQLAKEKGLILQVGFMRRFDPDVSAAKKAIEGGTIGTPVIYKACHRDQSPPPPQFCDPKKSGGIILDCTIHEFDAGRFLFNDEITEVFAFPGIVVDQEIGATGDLDNAAIQIRFAKGGVGQIDTTRNSKFGEDIRFEILGSTGNVFWGALPMRGLTIATEAGASVPTNIESPGRFIPAFEGQIKAFAKAVETGIPQGATGEDSARALAVGLAAYRSIELKRPVKVEEILR